MPSVEAAGAAGRVLRTTGSTGDAAVHIELQLVILENMTVQPDLTLYITMTVTIGFISFKYKLLD